MKIVRSKSSRLLGILTACGFMAFASSAFAASTWSNLGSGGATPCAATASSGLAMGNVLACGTQTGVSLNVVSFSTNNDGVQSVAGQTSTSGTIFAAAAVYNWGSGAGLGVVNINEDPTVTGPHAIDNQYGTDAIRLTFTSALSLTSVGIGWNGTDNFGMDSDLSVLAWTGPGSPTGGVSTKTLSGTPATSTLLTSGWTLVGNYADVGALTNNAVAISSSIYSSYWLISAYNTSFGTVNSSPTLDANGVATSLGVGTLDYFKLLSVAGNTKPPGGNAPEPGSLALMGAALAGMLAVRRRKGQVS